MLRHREPRKRKEAYAAPHTDELIQVLKLSGSETTILKHSKALENLWSKPSYKDAQNVLIYGNENFYVQSDL